MSDKRKNRLKEDLQAAVDLLQAPTSTEGESTRFVLTELEELAVRFLLVNDAAAAADDAADENGNDEEGHGVDLPKKSEAVEYSLSCCRDEYPCNTVVSCSLEPNKMTIVNYDLPSVMRDLRDMALTTTSPPLPSMLSRQLNRRRSIASASASSPTEVDDTRKMRKIRSNSHPGKCEGRV